jgi:hypothetical protein
MAKTSEPVSKPNNFHDPLPPGFHMMIDGQCNSSYDSKEAAQAFIDGHLGDADANILEVSAEG